MLNRVRALENQCYLISSNSVGMNQGTQFVGHSMVVDPWGTILAGGGDKEITLNSDVDRSGSRQGAVPRFGRSRRLVEGGAEGKRKRKKQKKKIPGAQRPHIRIFNKREKEKQWPTWK